jgi:hypothetical protein
MLKERKVLVEQEIEKLKKICAADYLALIRGEAPSAPYEPMREKLTSLMVDLSLIEKMIADGQE